VIRLRRTARQRAHALVANIPFDIAVREVEVLKRRLGLSDDNARGESIADSAGPGNAAVVEIESEHATEVVSAFGSVRRSAEAVASEAAEEARRYLAAPVPVGTQLADQLLVPLALAGGGSFVTTKPSRHAVTNAQVIRDFVGTEIRFLEHAAPHAWRCDVGGEASRPEARLEIEGQEEQADDRGAGEPPVDEEAEGVAAGSHAALLVHVSHDDEGGNAAPEEAGGFPEASERTVGLGIVRGLRHHGLQCRRALVTRGDDAARHEQVCGDRLRVVGVGVAPVACDAKQLLVGSGLVAAAHGRQQVGVSHPVIPPAHALRRVSPPLPRVEHRRFRVGSGSTSGYGR
jgi:hypothetical protein